MPPHPPRKGRIRKEISLGPIETVDTVIYSTSDFLDFTSVHIKRNKMFRISLSIDSNSPWAIPDVEIFLKAN